MESKARNDMPEGLDRRVSATIITFFGSIIAIILWLLFSAEGFSVYQNIAVVVVILLGFVAVMGAMWTPWGMRQARTQSDRRDSK